MMLFGVGLVGEYVGRIYQQVRQRPRYMIRAVLEKIPNEEEGTAVAIASRQKSASG
jgi:undecaprenyl-phosphate 4-deoxy-4-formamido-L-arabinose transferase